MIRSVGLTSMMLFTALGGRLWATNRLAAGFERSSWLWSNWVLPVAGLLGNERYRPSWCHARYSVLRRSLEVLLQSARQFRLAFRASILLRLLPAVEWATRLSLWTLHLLSPGTLPRPRRHRARWSSNFFISSLIGQDPDSAKRSKIVLASSNCWLGGSD